MIWVLSLCGLGQRFTNAGYITPKPFLQIHGKAIIDYVIDALGTKDHDKILLIMPAFFQYHAHYQRLSMDTRIYSVFLYNPTKGVVDSAYQGLKSALKLGLCNLQDGPVHFVDGDTYYTTPLFKLLEDTWACPDDRVIGGITVFPEPDQSMTGYSFVSIENQVVVDIAEKCRISDLAVSGCYSFRSVEVFLERARICLEDPAYLQKGEYYMSGVYKLMISRGEMVRPVMLSKTDVVCLGTPEQAIMALPSISCTVAKQRFCFNLDETMVSNKDDKLDRNKEFMRFLKDLGHTIIIYTTRAINMHDATVKMLAALDIPYDELYFGKPEADYYFDDHAISHSSNWEKETGYYKFMQLTPPRDFNTISVDHENDMITKTSKSNVCKLHAEIHYYKTIPKAVRYMFPELVRHTQNSYTITLIKGPTLSTLFVNELLQPEHVKTLLCQLDVLHACADPSSSDVPDIPYIVNFYRQKLRQRLAYTPRMRVYIDHMLSFLEEYRPTVGIIHGDPVFTNVLYQNGYMKFIDMMGLIGDTPTIWGDVLYDYAKVYQSLLGYDEILQDHFVSFAYKQRLLSAFEHHAKERFGAHAMSNIRHMTIYLILCLLPLHNPRVVNSMEKLLETLSDLPIS